ncbi:hypothetical protein B0H17DRAFT_123065 [Mycena rosella]|uniref:C3H1-type domain-containing protein n=1 Tax=Mycena rosella TaxID=1033263 RepID=A0AAD7D728_MYCRO|nr:hypothetical protein B0H17DRAFT_123065 [Mycena rosella]
MSSQKRRVLVAFEEDDAGRDQKRQRKIAVSIDNTATNADLAREIAATLDQPAVTLEIAGGFELRAQDGIDMIAEDDIVTARSCAVQMDVAVSAPKRESRFVTPSTSTEVTASPEEPTRLQIRFVTAELARVYARGTPKEQSEATNGVLAFDGESVSGNTTLKCIKHEAARVLGWAEANSLELDDGLGICDRDHDNEGACSCPISQEIAQYGLSSTLHCRFTTNGSSCGNQCPYSHAKLPISNAEIDLSDMFSLRRAISCPMS